MLKNLSRGRAIAMWCTAVLVAMTASLLAGPVVLPGTWALLIAVSLMPPAIAMVIWRAAPPTVAEVLYATRQQETR